MCIRDRSSSPPAASPSPDTGTSAPAAPLLFAGMAHRVRRGKSKIDYELGEWQELEGGGRVLNIRLSNALVCSQFPRRPIPQPLSSERWQADSGASASITNDRRNMFNVRDVNPNEEFVQIGDKGFCLLYTSPSPRDQRGSRMPSSA